MIKSEDTFPVRFILYYVHGGKYLSGELRGLTKIQQFFLLLFARCLPHAPRQNVQTLLQICQIQHLVQRQLQFFPLAEYKIGQNLDSKVLAILPKHTLLPEEKKLASQYGSKR